MSAWEFWKERYAEVACHVTSHMNLPRRPPTKDITRIAPFTRVKTMLLSSIVSWTFPMGVLVAGGNGATFVERVTD